MRRIHLLAAKRLVGASVVGVGAYALRRTSRAHCENSAAASPPLDASSSAAVAKAAANGDLTAQNLDMNIARVEDWKAAIESAKQAWASDRRTEAETLLRAALDKAAYFGAESPPVATSLHNLAELLKRTARPKEAAPLYERALQIFEKTAGPAHRTTTTCLLALAGLRDEAGERAAARALYARAADALRAAALEEPKKSPGLAAVLVRLGEAQSAAGAYADAIETLTEAVRICGARWGDSSPRVALPRLVLAEAFLGNGDRTSAKAEALAALAVAPSEAQRARAERVLTRCGS